MLSLLGWLKKSSDSSNTETKSLAKSSFRCSSDCGQGKCLSREMRKKEKV